MATKDESETSHGGKRAGAGRPRSGRDDISVKLDRGVAARARYVADLRGITLAEYLTVAVQPIVDRDFAKATKPTGQL